MRGLIDTIDDFIYAQFVTDYLINQVCLLIIKQKDAISSKKENQVDKELDQEIKKKTRTKA